MGPAVGPPLAILGTPQQKLPATSYPPSRTAPITPSFHKQQASNNVLPEMEDVLKDQQLEYIY